MSYNLGHRIRHHAIVATAALVLLHASFAAGDPIDFGGYRPHYQGFGVNTPAGRGGAILRVTNLNDSGAGSLRAAMETTGARLVIFETSGTIALQSPIIVTNPYLTVAGQTAPSPGINIRNQGMKIDTHDVVIQHIRFREGDTAKSPGEAATILIGTGNGGTEEAAHNIVIDHVSCAWTMYMCFAVYDIDGIESGPRNYPYHPYDVSFLDSLFAYGLRKTIEFTGGGGGLGAPVSDYGPDSIGGLTMARTLFVHNSHRQPISSTGRRWQVVNNVVYGSGPNAEWEGYSGIMLWQNAQAGHDTNSLAAVHAAIVGNWFIPSLGTGSGDLRGSDGGNKTFYFNFSQANIDTQDNRVWLSGNQGPYITGSTGSGQRSGILWGLSSGGQDFSAMDIWYASEPQWQTGFSTIATAQVPAAVFANAGARPLDRDQVDSSAVAQANAGLLGDTPNMGSRITFPSDMGGYPTMNVNVRSLQTPASPHAVAPGQSFRTNIEVWLESLAQSLESGVSNTAPTPPTGIRFSQ